MTLSREPWMAQPTPVQAATMMLVQSGHVVGDNAWLWRADHTATGPVSGGARAAAQAAAPSARRTGASGGPARSRRARATAARTSAIRPSMQLKTERARCYQADFELCAACYCLLAC